MKKLAKMIILTLLCVILIDNYQQKLRYEKLEKVQSEFEAQGSVEEVPEEPVEENYVTLLALGQTLLNDSALNSGVAEDGSRSYDFLFQNIDAYLEEADISVMCHGSVLAGNAIGVSGYPTFNAPEEFAAAALAHGIDAVAMANVRINRLGPEAILTSKHILEGMSENWKVLGIHETETETSVPMIEAHGIKIALLNYTAIIEDTIANEESGKVSFFGTYRDGHADLNALSEKTLAEIDLANKTTDFVVVFASWGIEDTHEITDTQKRFAKLLTEAGVDLIIGNRTNYLQRAEWIQGDNGNRAFCYYSIGNYVSSENTADALVGGMAKVGIKVENGLTVIDEDNLSLIPVITYYTGDAASDMVQVKGVIPFEAYTDEMAASHGLLTKYGREISREIVSAIVNTNSSEAYSK